MLAILGLSIVAGVAAAALIVRSITGPLRDALRLAQQGGQAVEQTATHPMLSHGDTARRSGQHGRLD